MDMKKYILIILSVFLIVSCSKEESIRIEEPSGISLTMFCSDPTVVTKVGKDSIKDGEDPYNENLIKTIDYFFYPEGATDQKSVLHNRVSVNASGSYTVNIAVDANVVNTVLFPRGKTTCQVAVLVNYPEVIDHSSLESSTLEDIKNLTLTTDFKNSPNSPIQNDFVMFGTTQATLIDRTAKLVSAPKVELKRVASKITVDLHVAPLVKTKLTMVIDGVTYNDIEQEWEPLISKDNLKVYLQNAVKRALVSGNPSTLTFADADYFKYSQKSFTDETITRNEKEYMVSLPFYTYPQTWEPNVPHEPFIKIVLPWKRHGGSAHGKQWQEKTKQFYYKVILPNNAEGFVNNNWYHIFLDIGVLGSETDDKAVDITGQYYVVDWKSTPKSVDIKSARYLSVSQTDHIMYNTTELKIPYVTSNKCVIANLSVRQYDFKNRRYNDYSTQATNWVTLDDNNNIVINHNLNNDITTNTFDVAPYEYTFRIRHNDSEGATYYRDLTVLQYPAMYIEQERSNGYAFVKRTGNRNDSDVIWDDNGYPGYYYLNTTNVKRAMGSMAYYYDVNGSGDNNNQYQYTIHVTVLPDGSTSSIGDPRVPTGQTLDRLAGLTNYKPAAENTQDIIAPVFRIASSYGKTYCMTYEGAQKRCAAYQENGYPAGRWRLPTKAEIEYLITLSNKGKIPTLFGSESNVGYWAAGRDFFVAYLNSFLTSTANPYDANDGAPYYRINGSNYNVYTRCVYDEWYWVDGKDNAHLTSWGGYQTTEP